MREFLRALQGSPFPEGTVRVLSKRFGTNTVQALINAKILERAGLRNQHNCADGTFGCSHEVVENPGDVAFPFVAVAMNDNGCRPVRLKPEDLIAWKTSLRGLCIFLSQIFRVQGPPNLNKEVFPWAFRLGRALWEGIEREVVLCTNFNGELSVPYLTARRTSGHPTLVLGHARTRYMPPDLEARFASGPVRILFLEDVLTVIDDRISLRRSLSQEKPAPHADPADYCVRVTPDIAEQIDESTYRATVARAEDYDLFLDLLSTLAGGRHRACRRDASGFHDSALTVQQAWAYAELMERRRPMRAGELSALNSFGSPEKQVEAARRVLDVKNGRYEWRATKLLRGDDRQANRYLFQPPEGLRWVLLRPLALRNPTS